MSFTPLHPILVNFTAALLPASVLSDWLGKVLHRESLQKAACWMLVYGALVTPFTALAGWLWLRDMADMDHPEMAVHKWLGTGLAGAYLLLAFWRWRIYTGRWPLGWTYLVAATLVCGALVVQGHIGGTMSFGTSEAAASQRSEHGSTGSGHHTESQWRPYIELKE